MRIKTQLLAMVPLCILCGCASSERKPYTAESIIRAQQAQRRNPNTPTSTPAAAAPAPSPEPTQAVEQSYPENSEHWIRLVRERGSQIELEDGSVWEIAPQSHTETIEWPVAEKLVVTRGISNRYPFKLTNRRKNIAVDARLIATKQER